MDQDVLTKLLTTLTETISGWVNCLPLDEYANKRRLTDDHWAELAKEEANDFEHWLCRVVVHLGAARQDYLADLVTKAVSRVLLDGLEFVEGCRKSTKPAGQIFWETIEFGDFLNKSDSELAAGPQSPAYRAARSLFTSLCRCDDLFETIDREMRRLRDNSDPPGNPQAKGYSPRFKPDPCPICRSTETQVRNTKNTIRYFGCASCGHHWKQAKAATSS